MVIIIYIFVTLESTCNFYTCFFIVCQLCDSRLNNRESGLYDCDSKKINYYEFFVLTTRVGIVLSSKLCYFSRPTNTVNSIAGCLLMKNLSMT